MSLVIIGHVCSERRSFRVAFDGPDAESVAVDYITRRYAIVDPATGYGNVVFWEPEDENGKPAEVPDAVHRAMYPSLYAECEHGLSQALCYGPDHWCSPEEVAMGW